jgi:REP element-mobilizing transposase RayT
MTRTAQKLYFLRKGSFKEILDRLIKTLASIYYIDLHAHSVMDNHYHLALSVNKPEMDPEDIRRRFEAYQSLLKYPKPWNDDDLEKYYKRFTDLSKFMWELNRRSALKFNNINDTVGHLWGGRFKSVLVEDETALLNVINYIEQNAVQAGMVEKPSEYAYCSAGQIKRDLNQNGNPKVPEIGWFRDIPEADRAITYVVWHDYLAELIRNPEKNAEAPPLLISPIVSRSYNTKNADDNVLDEHVVDWSKQTYGTPKPYSPDT